MIRTTKQKSNYRLVPGNDTSDVGATAPTFPLDNLTLILYGCMITLIQAYGGKMKFTNDIPIYLQLIDKIKEQLIIGEFRSGDKMPSVREYSKKIKVNPTTIQRVYKELEMEGLIHTKRGMGSFITDDSKLILKMKTDIATKLTDNYIMKMSFIGLDIKKLQEFLKKHISEVNDD